MNFIFIFENECIGIVVEWEDRMVEVVIEKEIVGFVFVVGKGDLEVCVEEMGK